MWKFGYSTFAVMCVLWAVNGVSAQTYDFKHDELQSITPSTMGANYKVTVVYKSPANNRKASISGYVIPNFDKDKKQPGQALLPITNQTAPTTGDNVNSVELQSPVDATANGTLIVVRMSYKEDYNWYTIEKAQVTGQQGVAAKDRLVPPTVEMQVPAAPINMATGITVDLIQQPINEVDYDVTFDCGGYNNSIRLDTAAVLGQNRFTFTIPGKPNGSECMVCVYVRKKATGEFTRKCFWVKYSGTIVVARRSSKEFQLVGKEKIYIYALDHDNSVLLPTMQGEGSCRITNLGPGMLEIYDIQNKYKETVGPNTIEYKPVYGGGYIKAARGPTGQVTTTGIIGITRHGDW